MSGRRTTTTATEPALHDEATGFSDPAASGTIASAELLDSGLRPAVATRQGECGGTAWWHILVALLIGLLAGLACQQLPAFAPSGWAALLLGLASACGALALCCLCSERRQSRSLDPANLDSRIEALRLELGSLLAAQELQRDVFEVSADLVALIDPGEARQRFATALRCWWSCAGIDLFLWERGKWRVLGDEEALGPAPDLDAPVSLPPPLGGDLVLDLSPAVQGQAALVLRQAKPQPTLAGRDEPVQRYLAEVLRGQFALSLRRLFLYQELQDLGRSDPLTGTYRRWYGEARLGELIESGGAVAVAMVDIDFFKKVNDRHGHAAGDLVLAAVGRALIGQVRAGDLVFRYGGEEFCVILPDTSPGGAVLAAERFRLAVEDLAEQKASAQGPGTETRYLAAGHGASPTSTNSQGGARRGQLPETVTVSLGVAACREHETVATLLARADEALYAAKAAGRNRVVAATQDQDPRSDLVRSTRHLRRTAPPDSSQPS